MRTVIFGEYKTGTTGLYKLLHHNYPKDNPRELFEAKEYRALPGDCEQGVLAKVIMPADSRYTHGKWWHWNKPTGIDSFRRFEKKLVLSRDPRDWFVSGLNFIPQLHPAIYNHKDKRNKVLELWSTKIEHPQGISCVQLYKVLMTMANEVELSDLNFLKSRYASIIRFLNSLDHYFHIRYEDFIEDKTQELEKYLGFSLNPPAQDGRWSHVPRAKVSGQWKDWFTQEDCELLKPYFEPYMQYWNYPNDWRLNPEPVIEEKHSLRYVEKTMLRKAKTQ